MKFMQRRGGALRRIIFIAGALLLPGIAAGGLLLWRGANPFPQTPAWPGAALPVLPSTAEEADMESTLPLLSLDAARPLLQNPDRGLRMETYITLGEPPESYPGNAEDPCDRLLRMIETYREESPTVVQLYVYLCRYNEKPLDGPAFAQLERMLVLCKENRVRALLRFAYQNESNPDPDWPRVREHLYQLAAWFRAHGELVEDTLYCVQAGIVGYWGEGHTNQNLKSRYIGRVFDRVCRMAPEDTFVQVRTADLMRRVSGRYKGRLGMHDDYLIGELNGPWSFFGGPAKRAVEARFPRTVNDGEMPWGVATYYDREDGAPLDSIDALALLAQIRQYSLTTLSLEHNYREVGPERVFSMARWKDAPITAAQLRALGMPYLPSLFGEEAMPAFDYIQYHLGYLLSITRFELDAEKRQLRFTIRNDGFAAPLNANALSLVIDGTEYLVGSYDKFALGSMRAVTYTVDLPEGCDLAAPRRLGVRLARRVGSALCVRFANDTPFKDGVQIMA